MFDLEKGSVTIHGIEITKDTTLEDFKKAKDLKASIKESDDGFAQIRFIEPISAAGINMYAVVTYFSYQKQPEIGFFCNHPKDMVDDGYGNISKFYLECSKKWLSSIIGSISPTTNNEWCFDYSFEKYYVGAMISMDREYGLIDGTIDVLFRG